MKKIIKYGCYALLVCVALYYSHKRVYWVGWDRGAEMGKDVTIEAFKESLEDYKISKLDTNAN